MKRSIESALIAWKSSPKRKPLVLKGARQVGKTWTLKHFGEHCFKKYHYINFEKNKSLAKYFQQDLDPVTLIAKLSVALNADIDLNTDLLILDEIQEVPRALTALKYFAEDMPELAICAAGSLLGLMLESVSFPVGKVDYLYMYPMTFFEFLEALGETRLLNYIRLHEDSISGAIHEQLWDFLRIYFIVGGLPEVVATFVDVSKQSLQKRFELVRVKQKQIISSYLDDMTKHSGKENSMHVERLWRDIPSQLAKEQDSSVSRFQFKGVIPGIKAYSRLAGVIDWLEATGLIIKVKIVYQSQSPLSAFCKENRFKLYVFDVGVLGALSGLRASDIYEQDYGNYKGYYAENYVAQELKANEQSLEELYSWVEGRAELEFLRDGDCGIIPVEVKAGSKTQAKSLKSYIERYSPTYSLILGAKDPSDVSLSDGVKYRPLYMAGML